MGRVKPRIWDVVLPPHGTAFFATHDRSRGQVTLWHEGERIGRVRLHKTKDCVGRNYCAIHRPSDHPLKEAGMILRLDRDALIERVCEHGIGHSDPDSVEFLVTAGVWDDGTHGCDGCCEL